MATITQFIPPLIIGHRGDQCAVCKRNLQAHMCQMQPDGKLHCLTCIGSRAELPLEVVQTLAQMEAEHGKK